MDQAARLAICASATARAPRSLTANARLGSELSAINSGISCCRDDRVRRNSGQGPQDGFPYLPSDPARASHRYDFVLRIGRRSINERAICPPPVTPIRIVELGRVLVGRPGAAQHSAREVAATTIRCRDTSGQSSRCRYRNSPARSSLARFPTSWHRWRSERHVRDGP